MTNHHENILIAVEGYLRNASYVDAPFMVKGSIITRQFFPNPAIRYVQDLDWVYLEKVNKVALAGNIFSKWVIEVTENNRDENVWFRSFRDNNFWRDACLDYLMPDDFPTINTDLYCIVKDKHLIDVLDMDISFNLDIDFPPEEMIYQPVLGEAFKIDKVSPYCLQVSWKLHQLLVRPRLKDIFDLIYLLQHQRFNKEELEKIIFALKKECRKSDIEVGGLMEYINGKAVRDQKKKNSFLGLKGSPKSYCHNFTNEEYFSYESYAAMLKRLQSQLITCGFTPNLLY